MKAIGITFDYADNESVDQQQCEALGIALRLTLTLRGSHFPIAATCSLLAIRKGTIIGTRF